MKSILILISVLIVSYAGCEAALLDHLVAYYDFEDTGEAGLANKAPDATGYDATLSGGPWRTGTDATGPGFAGNATYNPGDGLSDRGSLLAGNAINFADIDGDFIVVPLGTAELGNVFSISAWIYLAPGASNGSLRFQAFEASDNYDVSWGTLSDNTSLMRAYVGQSIVSPDIAITHEQWQHVVHVFSAEGANTRLTVYVDGSQVGTHTVATTSMNFPSLYFGDSRTGSGDRDWDGMMDEISIWDRALSAMDVLELYHRGTAALGVSQDLAAIDKVFVGMLSETPVVESISGTGIHDLNSLVSISLSSPGYETAWTGDFTGQPSSFTYTAVADARSVATFFGPDLSDEDSDGLAAYDEVILYGTLPDNPDSDGDGIPDGTEVNETQTNPAVSDSALIDFIAGNYGTLSSAGFVAAPSIDVDPGTGNVTLGLSFSGSVDGTSWYETMPASVIFSGNNLEVALPAPSASINIYRLYSKHP